VQPLKRGANWQSTIAEQRFRIGKLLEENPSFRPELGNWIDAEYEHGFRAGTVSEFVALHVGTDGNATKTRYWPPMNADERR
jgi:hypothetical protein